MRNFINDQTESFITKNDDNFEVFMKTLEKSRINREDHKKEINDTVKYNRSIINEIVE